MQSQTAPAPGLILQRKAAHILNQMCRQIGLGSMAEFFDSENFDEWDRPSDWECMAMRHGTIVAYVAFRGEVADVTIPSWYGLVRMEHRAKFNPQEKGLTVNHSFDPFTEDKVPDVVMENYAYGEVPGLELPHHPMPKRPYVGELRVESSR